MNFPVVLCALALLGGAAALAAEPPAAPSATPVKHPTLKSCNREASARQLAEKQREQYVKDCLAGKAQGAPQPPAPR
ncbi:MAG TPA: hypothetical protein VMT09_04600 [Steroidobacteraceae bacterium]|nr:hypothetical protein [Steroidobacteraceae bacterium]